MTELEIILLMIAGCLLITASLEALHLLATLKIAKRLNDALMLPEEKEEEKLIPIKKVKLKSEVFTIFEKGKKERK